MRALYVVSVERDLISRVTDAVMDVLESQNRTLDDVYPVLILDSVSFASHELRRVCVSRAGPPNAS